MGIKIVINMDDMTPLERVLTQTFLRDLELLKSPQVPSELDRLQTEQNVDMAGALHIQPPTAVVTGGPESAFGAPAPLDIPAAAPCIAVAGPLTIAPDASILPPPPANVPPPPAVIAEPSASIAAPPSTSHAETDSEGMPWDYRIHGENKSKIANGTWRKKRGVDPALVAQIEHALRGGTSLADMPAPVVAAPPAVVAPPPPPTVVVAAPHAAATNDRDAYVKLVGNSAALIKAGTITIVEINQICESLGIGALPLLISRLDLVPQVSAAIDALVLSRAT